MSGEMTNTYVTFGQAHRHEINGDVFDKDCVAVIEHKKTENGRELAFKYFGPKFCFEYSQREFEHHVKPDMGFFPRGLVKVNSL